MKKIKKIIHGSHLTGLLITHIILTKTSVKVRQNQHPACKT